MMTNLKNFQKYRLEVTKLSVHFDFADDMSTFARSDSGRGSPRSQEGELGSEKIVTFFLARVDGCVD